MSIYNSIKSEMNQALKDGEKEKRVCYQTILSAMKNKAIDLKVEELPDDTASEIITKLYKQNTESLDTCPANRKDIKNKLSFEREILEKYLPKQLTVEEVCAIISNTISELGLENPTVKDKGLIMKNLMPKVKGKVDGKKVNEFLSSFLK